MGRDVRKRPQDGLEVPGFILFTVRSHEHPGVHHLAHILPRLVEPELVYHGHIFLGQLLPHVLRLCPIRAKDAAHPSVDVTPLPQVPRGLPQHLVAVVDGTGWIRGMDTDTSLS